MFLKKKTNWEFIEGDFDPKSVGFVYNPDTSVLQLIQELLQRFDENSPKPGHLHNFVTAILVDAIGFWQLKEEIRLASQFSHHEVNQQNEIEVLGFPVYLTGIEGVGLAIKGDLAPAMLRQQIDYQKQHIARVAALQEAMFGGKPAKEDMH